MTQRIIFYIRFEHILHVFFHPTPLGGVGKEGVAVAKVRRVTFMHFNYALNPHPRCPAPLEKMEPGISEKRAPELWLHDFENWFVLPDFRCDFPRAAKKSEKCDVLPGPGYNLPVFSRQDWPG